VVTTFTEPKFAALKFDMQRFDLKKLNNAQVMEPYQIKISNSFAHLKNTDDNVDINRASDNIMRTSNFQPRRV
jgi:hypothetical protein